MTTKQASIQDKKVKIVGGRPQTTLKMERDKDREKVKGVFKFYEVPGGSLSFIFRKYKEDPIEKFTMVDGQVYTIPLGVAKHLNKNGWYPRHAYQLDDAGKPIMTIGEKVHRFGFQSLEFQDIEDLEPDSKVVTVESMTPAHLLIEK